MLNIVEQWCFKILGDNLGRSGDMLTFYLQVVFYKNLVMGLLSLNMNLANSEHYSSILFKRVVSW